MSSALTTPWHTCSEQGLALQFAEAHTGAFSMNTLL